MSFSAVSLSFLRLLHSILLLRLSSLPSSLSLSTLLATKHCSAMPHVFIIIKAHLMQEVSCVYRSRFMHTMVTSLSSVVSICLLNLSRSLLFLSLSSLVAMLHHMFWLSVFVAYSLLHVMLVYPGVGLSVFASWIFMHETLVRLSCDNHPVCGFRVHNISFHARDFCTTLASTTDQCGAHSGSPQLIHQKD